MVKNLVRIADAYMFARESRDVHKCKMCHFQVDSTTSGQVKASKVMKSHYTKKHMPA